MSRFRPVPPWLWAALPVVLVGLSGGPAGGQPPAPVYSETFEGDGLPAGWTAQREGELAAQVTSDPERPGEGKSALRAGISGWSGGVLRLRGPALRLRSGERYSLEVSLRAKDRTQPVRLSVQTPGDSGPETLCLPGESWRAFALTGWAAADAPVTVQLDVPGTGTLWLDGLQVIRGVKDAPLPAAPSPRKGNRLPNSSFELGEEGWSPSEAMTVAAGPAVEGERFVRWLPGALPIQSQPFRTTPGQTYTVSLSLRSLRPGAKVEVAFVELGGSAVHAETVPCAAAWQRAAFRVRAPAWGSDRAFLSLASAPDGAGGRTTGFDLDAVQVEEGDLTSWSPSASIEVATGLTRARRFPTPEGSIGIPVQLYAPGGVPDGAQLRVTLHDYEGQERVRHEEALRPGPKRREAPVQIRVPVWGSATLRAAVVAGGQVLSSSEAVLTCLPVLPTAPAAPGRGFLGSHGSVGRPGEWHGPTIASRAGIRWWRLHDVGAFTHWAVAEPARGQFRWYDADVTALRSLGLRILGVVARTPGWAGRDPGGPESHPATWPPARIADFGRFVRGMATHYRGRIDAYEIWNEPWSREHWAGSADGYAELVRAASTTIRAADPAAAVVGGCFWPPEVEFTDQVLSRGMLGHVNAVSFHQYGSHADAIGSAPARDRAGLWAQSLNGKLTLAGGKPWPLWNTEAGVGSPPYQSCFGTGEAARQAALELARLIILNRAAGVERLFQYRLWHERGPERLLEGAFHENWSLLDHEGSGKPTLAALATCARVLDDAVPVGRLESGTVRAFIFQRGPNCLLAAWSPSAFTEPLRLGLRLPAARLRYLDLMGNPKTIVTAGDRSVLPLTPAPAYIHVLATTPQALLEALKAAAQPAGDAP